MNEPMGSNRTTKRSKQRQELIVEMLRQTTMQKAAAAVGISEATAWRIRQMPEFKREYLEARLEAYSQAMARIQQGASNAATVLQMIMVDSKCSDSARVQAASRVLDLAKSSFVLEQLEQRVLQLEHDAREA